MNNKHAGGRPNTKMGIDEVERLCQLNCTMEELAAYFGVDVRTVQLRAQNEPWIRAAMERGQALGKLSLRREQFRLAEKGNAAMLMFLGKQLLGQRDKVEAEVTVKDGDMTLEQLLATADKLLELEKDKKK
jgi:hypothetical protein